MNIAMEDSLKKRYSIKLLANVISGLIGIVLVAMVPKALGPFAYGQFVYIQIFFTQVIGFLDSGSSIAFFTKLSARNSRQELIRFYFLFSGGLLLSLILCVVAISFLDYSQWLLPDIPTKYIFMGLLFGFLTWFMQILISISDAHALTVSVEIIKIAQKIFSLLLLIFFISYFAFDLSLYFYFHYSVCFGFIGAVGMLLIKKGIINKTLFSISFNLQEMIKEFITFCSPLFVYSVFSVAVGFFDIWLLQKIAGSEQTGFYGLAYSIVGMSFLFSSAMTPIITREFSKAYEGQDLEQMRSLFLRYIPMLYSVAAYFGIFIAFQSENVLLIFTDEKFKDVFWVLVIMAFYPLHQTYGQLSGSIFYATGQTKLYRNIGLLSMSIGVGVTFLLIYIMHLGALGLAFKMILIQFIATNIQLFFNAKFLNFKMLDFLWHQFYSILFFATFAFLASFVSMTKIPLLNFLISGVLYTLFVIIFTYQFPKIFAVTRDEIKRNLQRLKCGFKN